MKPKQLIPMAAILAILIVIGVISKSGPDKRPTLAEQAEYVPLLPSGVAPEMVSAIEFGVGGNDTAVRLEKSASDWVVASAWNAPAKTEKVESFLKTLKDLAGEFRSDAAAVRGDYGLEDEQALRIRLYTTGAEPAFRLLVGKKLGYDANFVRLAGAAKVYVVDKNLRSELGLWGDDLAKKPEAKSWLDTTLIKVDKDKVARLELTYPDHRLVFERQEKPHEKKTEAEDAPQEKSYAWVLAAGGPGGDFKQAELDKILEAFGNVDANDVVDPAKKEEYGLGEDGPFRCVVTLEKGETHTLTGVRKPGDSKAYVVVDKRPNLVYTMYQYGFDKIFQKGGKLFDLATPRAGKDAARTIAIERPGEETIVLARKDKDADWELQSPQLGFPLKKHVPKDLLGKLSDWSAESYADKLPLATYGLETPVCAVEVRGEAKGVAQRFLLGKEHPAIQGAYVKTAAGDGIYVMKEEDAKKVFVQRKDLLRLDLNDLKQQAIESVTVAPAGRPAFTLKRKTAAKKTDDGKEETTVSWVLVRDGKETPADKAKADDLVWQISQLTGDEILEGDAAATAFPEGQLDVVTVAHEGGTWTATLGAKRGKGRAARVDGRPVPVVMPADKAKTILPDPADLEKKEPAEGAGAETKKTVANPFESGEKKTTPVPEAGEPGEKDAPGKPQAKAFPGVGDPRVAGKAPPDNPFLQAIKAGQGNGAAGKTNNPFLRMLREKAKQGGGGNTSPPSAAGNPFGARPSTGKAVRNPFANAKVKGTVKNPFVKIPPKPKTPPADAKTPSIRIEKTDAPPAETDAQ